MTKRFKRVFYIIFSLSLVFGLSACTENSADGDQTNKVVDTQSLIDNIIEEEENQENEKQAAAKENEEEAVAKKEKKDQNTQKKSEPKKEDTKAKKTNDNKEKDKKNKQESEDLVTIKIKAFGDIMAHLGQTTYAGNKGGGDYDFSDQFVYMEDFIKDSDIAIGNYETTSNPNLEWAGYPVFNTPSSYPKYIKDAGFDILTTANNHSFDTGEEGVFTTIKAIEDAGLDHVGTHTKDGSRILYKKVNDVKIAFLAYTYGTNGLEGTIENNEPEEILNYLDEDLIETDIKTAKNNNADFIVVYPHWGIEYQSYPSADQISLGRKMIDWGADIVIGNHPHVVQPAEYYKTEDGRKGFIAYALGNYISLQGLETLGDIRTEHSVAYEITLTKDLKDDTTNIESAKAYPLWVNTFYNELGGMTQTYLVSDFLGDGKYADQVDVYKKDRIKQAQDMVNETVLTDIE